MEVAPGKDGNTDVRDIMNRLVRYSIQIDYDVRPSGYPARVCLYKSKDQIYAGSGPKLLPLLRQAAVIIHRREAEDAMKEKMSPK
jgi:hypothetical protein